MFFIICVVTTKYKFLEFRARSRWDAVRTTASKNNELECYEITIGDSLILHSGSTEYVGTYEGKKTGTLGHKFGSLRCLLAEIAGKTRKR